MSSNVGDPFLLASYPLPSRILNSKAEDPSRNDYSLIYASHSCLPGSTDGQVTIAAQGEGIHVLDLAALRPASSHTLGPSTTYACTPATSLTASDVKGTRRTCVVLESAPELKPSSRGRTVWTWVESLSDDLGSSSQDKRTYEAPHSISQIFVLVDLRGDVSLLSPEGELTWTDSAFQVRGHWSPPDPASIAFKAFSFSRKVCHFAPASIIPPTGTIFVIFLAVHDELRLQIMALGQDGELVALDQETIPVKPKDIADISCDESGHMSILTGRGLWSAYRIECVDGKVCVSTAATDMHLTGLTFISQGGLKSGAIAPSNHVSLLSLGSSHVLLAGITTAGTEIALLLWDVQYSVLLDSHMLSIPSTLPRSSPSEIRLSLEQGGSKQALLVISPIIGTSTKFKKSSSQHRSSVLVVPYNVPSTSTIANALGRAASGARWLDNKWQNGGAALTGGKSVMDAGRLQLLQKLREAVDQDKPDAANKLFRDWVDSETAKSKAKRAVSRQSAVSVDGVETHVCADTESKEKRKSQIEHNFSLGHSFVCAVLEIILQPGKPPNSPYPSQILHHLLATQVVSHSMLEGGLLLALSHYGDWEAILSFFKSVDDIPEGEMIRLLHVALLSHRGGSRLPAAPPSGDAMVVDQPKLPKTVAFPVFFATCVVYPSSATALRIALRKHFSDSQDVVVLLEYLEGWIIKWAERESVSFHQDVSVNEQGIHVAKPDRRKIGGLPDLENIVLFMQAIMDSSFLSLLQYTASHALLRRLLSYLDPYINIGEDLEGLRGSLEPFARAQSKALADARSGRKRGQEDDWRLHKRQTQDHNAIAVGLYQVEELAM